MNNQLFTLAVLFAQMTLYNFTGEKSTGFPEVLPLQAASLTVY